jgi:cytochrome c oxidase subunit II
MTKRRHTSVAGVIGATLACSGPQSALDPAGREAEALARIFWWMTAGCLVIWVACIGLALYAAFSPERRSLTGARRLIVYGGAVFPTVVLTILLGYGLALLPDFLSPAGPGSLRVAVTAEQYWWRVRYLPNAGVAGKAAPVVLANEIRLPVGEEVEFLLDAPDVIHSFWIPSLAGKVDMIPGRQTRLRLLPTRVGTYRGACAEYCGASHAWMAFSVVVQERGEFERWLAAQARPAPAPTDPVAREGQRVFAANGCGSCHTIRGSSESGVVGPDLTHVGSRLSLGAGLLPNQQVDFGRWVAETDTLKPGVHMPAFGMLKAPDLRAIAVYLESLE